ncbi:hypothetical protein IKG02_00650 [Candidatus Saccharibacteria bacterium]|nr:hypothetical protein [Candidatus Saccharibacteria bacterium]
MSTKIKSFLLASLSLVIAIISTFSIGNNPVFAAEAFSLSPMYDMVSLTPGETFESSFTIVNPASSTTNFYYELHVEPFTQDNEQNITATANGHYTDITEWIELSKTEGVVPPNSSEIVGYKINVPSDAPAGGQYGSISVSSKKDEESKEGFSIHEVFEMGYLIYAEVAGETVRKGDITDVTVPSFMFTGEIYGSAMTKNEGNVHSASTQTLQIFPLFSKEEVYTNEEDPKTVWIMPGNTTLSKVSWKETPSMGVFHVIYNVEYEGVESKVDKYVIVCPIWLLIIIIACVFLIIFSIVFTKKKSSKK